MTRKKLEKHVTAVFFGQKREAQKFIRTIREFLTEDASNADVLYRVWAIFYNIGCEEGIPELKGEMLHNLSVMVKKYGPEVGGRMRGEKENADGNGAAI